MAVVEFDIEVFRTRHPGFSDETAYTDEYLQECFAQAVIMISGNEDDSPVAYNPPTVPTRAVYLDLITCHLAALGTDDTSTPGMTTSATQGSVSIGITPLSSSSESGAYWNQTQCGARYWMLRRAESLGGRGYYSWHYHGYG